MDNVEHRVWTKWHFVCSYRLPYGFVDGGKGEVATGAVGPDSLDNDPQAGVVMYTSR
jgi:hypothetical protein